jgi:hypothetical protein
MDDKEILGRIDELIQTEHELREQADQCWDLLRQRRARREFGEDPSGTTPRPASEVEGYLQ